MRLTEEALAARIDPRANVLVERSGPTAGSGGVALSGDAVWISPADKQSVWRLPR